MPRTRVTLAVLGLVAVAVAAVAVAGAGAGGGGDEKLQKIDHIVVIYQENHSFDNLYGGWEGVNGRANADAAHTLQVNAAVGGTAFHCLKQNDVNLSALSQTCTDSTTATTFTSHFTNAPFQIDDVLPATASTCPGRTTPFNANGYLPDATTVPGGCTRDIVHRFYSEQFQLDNGKQDRYSLGSDAAGLTQGYYDTQALPIYQYLHGKDHPHYVIGDNFFQGAFGGSFLNHQWLVAAAAPVWTGADNTGGSNDLHSVLDSNGMGTSTPLYTAGTVSAGTVRDSNLTQSCNPPATRGATQPGLACGDYAVNTTQPWYQPYSPGTADNRRLPPLHTPNIGDELSAAGVDWAWYSGGWNNAAGVVGGPGWTNGDNGTSCTDPDTASGAVYPNCPNRVFQYHHQAFNYFYNYRPGTWARQEHLRDEAEFMQLAQSSGEHGPDSCNLKAVSFVKPIGLDNEHPGYTNETAGSMHLVNLLKAIEGSACAKDTLVVVTYDEFGGQWDHVPPPGQGGTAGAHDRWGPGTRIPALFIAPETHGDFSVDSTQYDTTSILATIEHRFGLAPLGTRDAAVNDFSNIFDAKEVHEKK